MTGLEHYPAGRNAFHMAPPKSQEKPLKPKRVKINKPKAMQAAISLETPEERKARQMAERRPHFTTSLAFAILASRLTTSPFKPSNLF